MDERLHKLLAQHGIGSRRQVEAWIREGRVLVNGKPAEIGQRVGPRDRVVVDGRDVIKRLAVAGWRVKRIRGSHHLMEKAGRVVPVPVHGAADIGKGLLAEIERQGVDAAKRLLGLATDMQREYMSAAQERVREQEPVGLEDKTTRFGQRVG